MRLEQLGLIGNCQYAALVSSFGEVVWCCLPRFDADPVFGSLLDPSGGSFVVAPADGSEGRQRYIENTNVLETLFETRDGKFRVLDFAPRLEQFGRMYRPSMLVRIIEPLAGAPQVSVGCRPVLGWSKASPLAVHGSNHIQYEGFD